MKMKFNIMLSLYISIISCTNKILSNEKHYSSGAIKELTVSDKKKSGIEIGYLFYETGGMKEIHRFNEKEQLHGEQFWFLDDGVLERKIFIYSNKAEGHAYYVYPNNGALKNDKYFRNDRQV